MQMQMVGGNKADKSTDSKNDTPSKDGHGQLEDEDIPF
jgi:hypothetical protein